MSFPDYNRPPGPADAEHIKSYLDIIEQQPPQVLTETLREQFAGELRQLLADLPSIGEKKAGGRFYGIIKRAMKEGGKKE